MTDGNIKHFILGRLPSQLADVFGQIDKLPRERIEDRVLDAWQSGKSSTVIGGECGVSVGEVNKILKAARFKGDARAGYRHGWAKGMRPGPGLKLDEGDY